jgi:hypothetical protein
MLQHRQRHLAPPTAATAAPGSSSSSGGAGNPAATQSQQQGPAPPGNSISRSSSSSASSLNDVESGLQQGSGSHEPQNKAWLKLVGAQLLCTICISYDTCSYGAAWVRLGAEGIALQYTLMHQPQNKHQNSCRRVCMVQYPDIIQHGVPWYVLMLPDQYLTRLRVWFAGHCGSHRHCHLLR